MTIGSGSGNFEFAKTLSSYSFFFASDISSKHGFFTFSMYPMFEHLGVVISSLPQFCFQTTICPSSLGLN
jgi:hypothetical protein